MLLSQKYVRALTEDSASIAVMFFHKNDTICLSQTLSTLLPFSFLLFSIVLPEPHYLSVQHSNLLQALQGYCECL